MRYLFGLLVLLLTPSAWALECVIGEYALLSDTTSGQVVPVATRLVTTQFIGTITTAEQSAAFDSETRYIRFKCDGKVHFLIGANPTADTQDQWVAQDETEHLGVAAGEIISVVAGT